jgi:DHA1 family tetracycline resistance protein-like MFS transporter
VFIIFFVIVLDLIGFGIMIPIFPYFAESLGAGPALATVLMATYSAALFISTPFLGRLSDYYGRKPVLLLSMAGAVIAYLMLASATTLWMIALARFIGGAMAGNLAAAQAYVADITSAENRAKGMGMVGAAFGIGFIVGPALGSALGGSNFEDANFVIPALFSATMSSLAFLTILFFLPESLPLESRLELRQQPRLNRLQGLRVLTSKPALMAIISCALVYNIGAGLVESLFPIWTAALGIIDGPRGLMPILLASGIVLVAIQGGLIGPMTRRYGELTLLRAGACVYATGLVGMAFAGEQGSLLAVTVAMMVQSAGAACVLTSAQSLASMAAVHTDRGMVMGVFSSAGTLGRTMGTLATGALFANLHVHSSYVLGACLALSLLYLSRSAAPITEMRKQAV